MKITVTFEGEEYEDTKNIEAMLNVQGFISVINDLSNHLRELIKYQDKDEFEPIREKLWQLINEEELGKFFR